MCTHCPNTSRRDGGYILQSQRICVLTLPVAPGPAQYLLLLPDSLGVLSIQSKNAVQDVGEGAGLLIPGVAATERDCAPVCHCPEVCGIKTATAFRSLEVRSGAANPSHQQPAQRQGWPREALIHPARARGPEAFSATEKTYNVSFCTLNHLPE
jgi:hypothetical protein